MVINYVLTYLASVGSSVNWAQLAAEATAYVLAAVDKFVPAFLQSFVNPGITDLINGAMQVVSLALADSTDLALIIGDLQAKDLPKALSDLEALLAKVMHPQQAAVVAAVQHLKLAA